MIAVRTATRWVIPAALAAALPACPFFGGGGGDDAGINEQCDLTPDPGDCDAAFERYAFDAASQRCVPFTWGGCDGVVPFVDLTTCQGDCEPCEAFFATTTPAPTHPEIALSVRNDSAAPIFLRAHTPGGGAVGWRAQTFQISHLGAEDPLVTAPNDCDFPCKLYDNAMCGNACSDAGFPPGPILIQPGATFAGAWSGLHFGQVALPSRCLPAACEAGLECGRWLNVMPGDFTAAIAVATQWSCTDPMQCTCTPNADGWCQLDAFVAQNGPVDAVGLTSDFSFPGATVEFVYK